MRSLPSGYETKIKKAVQAEATDAEPQQEIWVSRPQTQLTAKTVRYLERRTILSGNVTAADIAVRRDIPRGGMIYIAYIKNGAAKVCASSFEGQMGEHLFRDAGFSAAADDVAVCFDEDAPWVFWCKGGAAYGRIIGDDQTDTLSPSSCTKISAAQGAGGLWAFYLCGGYVYYRKFDGSWSSSQRVDAVSGTFVDLAAHQTGDGRIALQLIKSGGQIVELYSETV